MEQLDLFPIDPTEEWVFGLLLPNLSATLEYNGVGADNIAADKGKNYTSVCFITYEVNNVDDSGKVTYKKNKHLAFRICSRGKQHYFGIPSSFAKLIPADERPHTEDEKEGFLRYTFSTTVDGVMEFSNYLCKALEAVVDSIPKEFDCCSRVEQCSNVKRCINPRPDLAVRCGYRKKIKAGRIFYGKNRNID